MDKVKSGQNSKLVNLLSIACRAGKIISGEFVIEKAMSGRNNVKLLLLASDVSAATKAKYKKIAANGKILLEITHLTKDELARCIGKTDRAAVAVCDNGFTEAVLKILKTDN